MVKAVQSTHYTLCMSSFVCLKHDFSAALKLSTSLCLCLCLVTRCWTLAKLPYLEILVFRKFYKKSRRMTTTVTTSTFGTTAKGEEVTFCIVCSFRRESLTYYASGDPGDTDQWCSGGGSDLLGGHYHWGQVRHHVCHTTQI